MKSLKIETIPILNPGNEPAGYVSKEKILTDEIKGVVIESVSVKGPNQIRRLSQSDIYDVILSLAGDATIEAEGKEHKLGSKSIVRIPYNKNYNINVEKNKEITFLHFLKVLDHHDRDVISLKQNDHSSIYIRAIDTCPKYTEDIKSSKAVNRMILPEGMVPRFCMGSVETEGPDEVAEHEHPMLDQLFLGLEGCRCLCRADGEEALLTGNRILHIPLGSRHSVSVEEGDTMSYIWMDFFLTIEGQKYMNEQHKMEEESKD